MQVLVTHEGSQRTRVFRVNRAKLALGLAAFVLLVMAMSGAVYHFVFLTAAREGWPVVSQLVKLIVRDEIAQRDRFLRDNLDAIAQRVGEVQAKLIKLEIMGERVSGMTGMKPEELEPLKAKAGGGRGGPFVPASQVSLEQLRAHVADLDQSADLHTDLFTYAESKLLEARLKALLVPSSKPVDGPVGSGFGFRSDPISGRAALHSGLDFPADVGTPILASAGGIVLSAEWHPAYGHLLELDHGNGLTTRYAHCSKIHVGVGAIVKRGQLIAEVGNSGRSTGPHLHFEVLVDGRPQDPARFLQAPTAFAERPLAQPRR